MRATALVTGSCTVQVAADAAAPKPMAARRPKTDEAIAMFINDARTTVPRSSRWWIRCSETTNGTR